VTVAAALRDSMPLRVVRRAMRKLESVVLTERLPEYGLQAGAIGTVVLVHRAGERHEVEAVTLSGETVAVVTVRASRSRPSAHRRWRALGLSQAQFGSPSSRDSPSWRFGPHKEIKTRCHAPLSRETPREARRRGAGGEAPFAVLGLASPETTLEGRQTVRQSCCFRAIGQGPSRGTGKDYSADPANTPRAPVGPPPARSRPTPPPGG
jgi:hypothetical protein